MPQGEAPRELGSIRIQMRNVVVRPPSDDLAKAIVAEMQGMGSEELCWIVQAIAFILRDRGGYEIVEHDSGPGPAGSPGGPLP